MPRLLWVGWSLSLLLVASIAIAMVEPKITVTTGVEGFGPNYEVSGTMPYKALLVVTAEVVRTDTREVLRSVPGTRQWTQDDGAFRFRCAAPAGGDAVPVFYRVRCYETDATGAKGPEAVVECYPPN